MVAPGNLMSALGDLRVLELVDEKGQWLGKILADLGADVIKVEPPGGSAERRVGPFYQDQPHPERSLYFWHYNTSKRGITLNLEAAAGQEIVRRLIPTIDVVLDSFAPGYLPALGLGYEQLREINPRLVMCSITPFGQTGPWRDYLTTDLVHQAVSGQTALCGYNEEDVPGSEPIGPGGGNSYHIACHYAQIGLLGAICFRDFTGEGQYLDVSIHEACSVTTQSAIPDYFTSQQILKRQTGRAAAVNRNAPSQLLCKDGKYVNGQAGRFSPDRLRVMAEWMDQHGLAQDLLSDDYRDAAYVAKQARHVRDVVTQFVGSLTQDEVYHGAQQRGFAWGAIRDLEGIRQDAHWEDRGFFVEVEHPELGQSFTYPGAYAHFSASPWRISRRAPLIGEHNLEIYQELGLTSSELAVLREGGVI